MPALKAFDLSGRLALVTGASRGIGQALARGVAGAGADVVVASRNVKRLDETLAQIEPLGRNATALAVDVSSIDSIAALFEDLSRLDLHPDILINNAGTEEVCPSLDVREDLWDRIIDTNQKGAFFVAQGFARALIGAGRRGPRQFPHKN